MGEVWGNDIFLIKFGVYVVEFKDLETRVEVLEVGPWSFDNRPFIVKPWSIDAKLEREDVNEMPVWIRFPGWNYTCGLLVC